MSVLVNIGLLAIEIGLPLALVWWLVRRLGKLSE
ncbi:hypothetical protein MTBLM5_210049 [Magnetospirillum sp. LM-5]|nr:hypothetical protein MTBLM5_210049 [Magnetospirillum sp. LM-5]